MTTPERLDVLHHDTTKVLLDELQDNQLVYFLLNVGDGDAQVVLLPTDPITGARRAIIVDAGRTTKVPKLLDELAANRLLPTAGDNRLAEGAIALVVATHPHQDHIAGMAELLDGYGHAVDELWDPGYYHPTPDYIDMMRAIEHHTQIVYSQPASGLRRYIANVAVTVLSPSIQLRNRFDTYGVQINDSSISLRLEFPASRVIERGEDREIIQQRRPATLILGADAQTLSWSYVLTDFPNIPASQSAAAKAIRAAQGADLLGAHVLKVSHHASKHGVNLELVKRISPAFTLVSCASPGRHSFPHTVAQAVIREALDPIATSDRHHKPDADLGLFYTCDKDTNDDPLGSIAVVMQPARRHLWRFRDTPSEPLELSDGILWAPQEDPP